MPSSCPDPLLLEMEVENIKQKVDQLKETPPSQVDMDTIGSMTAATFPSPSVSGGKPTMFYHYLLSMPQNCSLLVTCLLSIPVLKSIEGNNPVSEAGQSTNLWGKGCGEVHSNGGERTSWLAHERVEEPEENPLLSVSTVLAKAEPPRGLTTVEALCEIDGPSMQAPPIQEPKQELELHKEQKTCRSTAVYTCTCTPLPH